MLLYQKKTFNLNHIYGAVTLVLFLLSHSEILVANFKVLPFKGDQGHDCEQQDWGTITFFILDTLFSGMCTNMELSGTRLKDKEISLWKMRQNPF